jgi:RNA polymerase sigma-70 factor (ECF subfamily)
MNITQLYADYRPLLFSIAYRMLGLVQDAEDIVQDVFVTLQQHPDHAVIQDYKAYLGKMVTNRCINELKSARKTRVSYIGQWLPEPLIDEAESTIVSDPARLLERQEEVTYSFLILLQTLPPSERAVYVLRETLYYSFDEIAELLDKTAVNCRKLYSRAKQSIARGTHNDWNAQSYHTGQADLALKFSHAFIAGNIEALVELLSEDAIVISDGGGKVRAALNPIYGRERAIALLSFSISKRPHHAEAVITQVNGLPGIMISVDERVTHIYTFSLASDGHHISNVYMIMNPDKIGHSVTKSNAHLS